MYNCGSLSSLFLWGQGKARGLERQVAAIRRIILEHPPPAVTGCEKNGHNEFNRKNVGQWMSAKIANEPQLYGTKYFLKRWCICRI
jgi:hypothetical protein